MKILYFTRGYTVHDDRFLRAFVANNTKVGYLTLSGASNPDKEFFASVGIEYLGDLKIPTAASTMQLEAALPVFLRVVTSFVPDLVLAGPLTDCGYIVAKAQLSCPWVAQSWAFDVLWEYEHIPESSGRVRFTLQNCSALFADCEAVVARCEALVKIRSKFVMPWGINLAEARQPRSRASIRRNLKWTGRRVFLHTRGLERIYSVETLLDAVRNLRDVDNRILLVLASDGSLRPDVEKYVHEHGLNEMVSLVGAVPHDCLLNYFSAADFYISCAASDGTSISLLEAMAFGLPPIVTDVGGNSEWIQDARNGWLVPFGSAHHLKMAMLSANELATESVRRIVERNQELVNKKGNWVHNFRFFLQFLTDCVLLKSSAEDMGSSPCSEATPAV